MIELALWQTGCALITAWVWFERRDGASLFVAMCLGFAALCAWGEYFRARERAKIR